MNYPYIETSPKPHFIFAAGESSSNAAPFFEPWTLSAMQLGPKSLLIDVLSAHCTVGSVSVALYNLESLCFWQF